MATTLIAVILLMASCKKEARSVKYVIDSVDSSGIYAWVIGTENKDKTTINLCLFNTNDFSCYEVHFHEGSPLNYKGYAPYTFHDICGSHNVINPGIKKDIDLKYDDFINLDATCVVHPMGNADVLARAGIGRNAPK